MAERAVPSALAGFVGKWQAREPGMRLAELFVAPAQRPLFVAWGALLYALREAAFELSDANLRLAKSSWWAQELVKLAQGGASHPIAQALAPAQAAPWPTLASALVSAAAAGESAPVDGEQALAQVRGLAAAIVAVEGWVFAGGAPPAAIDALAVHLLAQRLLVGQAADDTARLPLHLLARHQLSRTVIRDGGGAAAVRDWARELHRRLPLDTTAATAFRRLQWVLDRRLLTRLASGSSQPARPGPVDLWQLWRAARRG